jgi:hypothetical protein
MNDKSSTRTLPPAKPSLKFDPLLCLGFFALLASPLHAADRTWGNTATDYNAGASWGGSAPGSGDSANFNSAVTFQPALTALLVLYVFEVPKTWALVAILSAALPVGTGPFMMSQLYQRDAASSARAILVSTVLSVITISILVAWISQEL